jgi:predicted transcriptional regulator
MHFNIYLDDETGQQLAKAASEAGEKRNTIIRRALRAWLAQQAQPSWSQAVLAHQGYADMPAFESARQHLAAPVDDPLA